MFERDSSLRQRILGFAHFLGAGRNEADALRAAEERRWIDPAGSPTDEGRKLIDALGGQSDTRTTFRGLA